MKKLLFVFAFFCGVAVMVQAQDATKAVKTAAAKEEAGPKMTFEKETVDYGTIQQSADPNRVFKFTNQGNEPLVITSAKGSCGCTVPTYPQEPILPGQTAEIKVRYDTKRIGKFTKTVTITTNEKANSTHTLIIQGEVMMPQEQEGVPAKQSGVFNNGNN